MRMRGAKDYKTAMSSVEALQCMFVSLPLPRRQYPCSGTVPDMQRQCVEV